MGKEILFDSKARLKLKIGIDKLANAVKSTLGPRGRNVIIDEGDATPIITNDGVTIAESIDFKDPIENMGARVVREVASKTNKIVGDGTTTATVLTQAIIEEGNKNIAAGANPLAIRLGIEKAGQKVIEYLEKNSIKIDKIEEYRDVATLSAESKEIGNIISSIIKEVGKESPIKVEKSNSFNITSEIVKGLQFDKSFFSPYFVTDQARGEAIIENPVILITDEKIQFTNQIIPLLEKLVTAGKHDIVLLCEDLAGEALSFCVLNKIAGKLHILGIKAPGVGPRQSAILEDIAILTGGKFLSKQNGNSIEKATIEDLGRADKVVTDKENTTIIGGYGDAETIKDRIQVIHTLWENETKEHEKDQHFIRLSRMRSGVGIIKVGASSEVEQIALLHKTEDAVNATKAAIEEGIIPGGGYSLLKASINLSNDDITTDPEELIGVNILKKALLVPLKQIAKNAGENGEIIIDKILTSNSTIPYYGYDAKNKTYCNLIECGIIDPLKVVKTSLMNAISAAAIFLTTECVVAEERIDKKDSKRQEID